MVYVKKISAVFCALFVCLLCVLSINTQSASAVAFESDTLYSPGQIWQISTFSDSGQPLSFTLPSIPFTQSDGSVLEIGESVDVSIFDEFGVSVAVATVVYDGLTLQYNIVFADSINTEVLLTSNTLFPFLASDRVLGLIVNAPTSGAQSSVLRLELSSSFSDDLFSYSVDEFWDTLAYQPSFDPLHLYSLYSGSSGFSLVSYSHFSVQLSQSTDRIFVVVPLSDSFDSSSFQPWSDSESLNVYVTDFPTDWTGWLADSLSGFAEFEFAPGLSFGIIFASVFGVLMLWFLLHLFM